MYKDRMVYRVGDMVRVKHVSNTDVRADRVPAHRIGLIVSHDHMNSQFYDVMFGRHTIKFHYSFLRPLSTKSCLGGTK
jgi:hypothetical protein